MNRFLVNFKFLADPRNLYRWRKESGLFLRVRNRCCCCSRPATVVHHGKPVHLFPEDAFDQTEWWPTCEGCHLSWLHGGNFQNYVRNLPEVVAHLRRTSFEYGVIGK